MLIIEALKFLWNILKDILPSYIADIVTGKIFFELNMRELFFLFLLLVLSNGLIIFVYPPKVSFNSLNSNG